VRAPGLGLRAFSPSLAHSFSPSRYRSPPSFHLDREGLNHRFCVAHISALPPWRLLGVFAAIVGELLFAVIVSASSIPAEPGFV